MLATAQGLTFPPCKVSIFTRLRNLYMCRYLMFVTMMLSALAVNECAHAAKTALPTALITTRSLVTTHPLTGRPLVLSPARAMRSGSRERIGTRRPFEHAIAVVTPDPQVNSVIHKVRPDRDMDHRIVIVDPKDRD